jgi:hypothetical protein
VAPLAQVKDIHALFLCRHFASSARVQNPEDSRYRHPSVTQVLYPPLFPHSYTVGAQMLFHLPLTSEQSPANKKALNPSQNFPLLSFFRADSIHK